MLEVPAILLTRTLTSMLGRSFVGVPASGLLWGSVHARGAVALRFLRGSWLDPNNEIPRSSLAPNQLVVWPLVCIGAGIALSLASVAVDRAFYGALIPHSLTGSPETALEILSTVAGSMVSLTALVLTVVLVAVQLAMGQFSPRIVASILQDKPSQFAIGIFVGTFAHAMLSLSQVNTSEGAEFVPGVAIIVAFVLVIVSIMVLVLYVNHIGRRLRAASLIEAVSHQMRGKLEELYPERETEEHQSPGVVLPLDRGC